MVVLLVHGEGHEAPRQRPVTTAVELGLHTASDPSLRQTSVDGAEALTIPSAA